MKRLLFAVIFSMFLGLTCTYPLLAQETLTISGMTGSSLGKKVQKTLKAAYAEMGITLEIKNLPGKRALQMSNSGQTLGEALRVKNITAEYPNLVMVPVPLHTIEWVVVTKDKKFEITGPESIKPYKIGITNGIPFAKVLTRGMDVDGSDSTEIILKKIDKGRNDIGLLPRTSAKAALAKVGISGLTILEPPVKKIELFHFLHKSKADLIPQLTEILKRMTSQ